MASRPTVTVSGIGDEINPDLRDQLVVMDSLGLSHIELRRVGGTSVLDLDADELRSVRETLDEWGFGASAIASKVGKADVTDDLEPELDALERAITAADILGTDRIRVFSYRVPDDGSPDAYRDEVLRRMERKVKLAERADVTLLHENEKDLYGDVPRRVRDLHVAIDSPNFRSIFDPANYLEVGVDPYPDALLQVVEFVDYLHVKDAEFGHREEIRPAGEGDARIPDIVRTLENRGFSEFASIEPHLYDFDPRPRFSGPEGFEKATRAFQDVLDDGGHRYE